MPNHVVAHTLQVDCGETTYRGNGRLKDRVGLITTGHPGVSRALAIAFAREGADVVLAHAAEINHARDTAAWVRLAGRRAGDLTEDLSDEGVRSDRGLAIARARFGRLDIIANVGRRQPLEGHPARDILILEEADIVEFGTAALPYLSPRGSLINIVARASRSAPPLSGHIAAVAVEELTGILAQRYIQHGVRLNTIVTGAVSAEGLPAGRVLPAEIALACVFLASDEANDLCGCVLALDDRDNCEQHH
ncbi:MAG: dehydrogenase [Gammaproteobacteria bacterium]|nr:dehydrogenase [Gammaproteobacteria bacterium]